jgi:PHD/YefM family antitoxin component YafN of YafNO toxin-antitoxin module
MEILNKIFVPISVSEREPDKNGFHFCLCTLAPPIGDFVNAFPQVSHFKVSDSEWSVQTKRANVTHWLEEKQNCYVLSEEVFRDMLEALEEAKEALQWYKEIYEKEAGGVALSKIDAAIKKSTE